MAAAPLELLTTADVAELLRIHPKQVYRLLRRGLPGRRVGGEWRFGRAEVLAWVQQGPRSPDVADEDAPRGAAPPAATSPPISGSSAAASGASLAPLLAAAPPLLAANGDVAVEELLAQVNATGSSIIGFVQADRGRALELLARGAVLAAGCHGHGFPSHLAGARLARVHLVTREVGLAVRPDHRLPSLSGLTRLRFATRPRSAGVSAHLERALRDARVDVTRALARSFTVESHRAVVCALLQDRADVGLTTHAWATRAGLTFSSLASESYGLVTRASDLGDPRIVRLCEVAQSARYRAALAEIPGYDSAGSGDIRYDPEADAPDR